MRNLKVKNLIIGSVIALAATSASAQPTITGEMEMTGSFYPVDNLGMTVSNVADAKKIDFDLFGSDAFRATSGDGDFSGLAGVVGAISDFQFDSFSSPIANFWTIDDFAFELTSLERGISKNPQNVLVLNGVGIISHPNFDNTAANWRFTGDASGGSLFSWSATPSFPVIRNVPEPGMLALLTVGLIGLGLRKKLGKS